MIKARKMIADDDNAGDFVETAMLNFNITL